MTNRLQQFVYRAGTLGLGGLFSLTCRARLFGREHLPPSEAVLLACNHQSFLDPALVGSLAVRPLHYMARESLFRVPGLGVLIRLYNAFPVRSDGTDIAAFRSSMRILRNGGALLVFPEGTRSREGRVGQCQPGIIHLARRAHVPILPVAIEGAFEAWPRSARFPKPAQVLVQFGRLIGPTSFDDLDPRLAAVQLTESLRSLHNELRKRAGRPMFRYDLDQTPDDAGRNRAGS